MGLESHITQVIDESDSNVYPTDYWFENGLKTDSIITAKSICSILNASGEFGEATIKELEYDLYAIRFGRHRSFLEGKSK